MYGLRTYRKTHIQYTRIDLWKASEPANQNSYVLPQLSPFEVGVGRTVNDRLRGTVRSKRKEHGGDETGEGKTKTSRAWSGGRYREKKEKKRKTPELKKQKQQG